MKCTKYKERIGVDVDAEFDYIEDLDIWLCGECVKQEDGIIIVKPIKLKKKKDNFNDIFFI